MPIAARDDISEITWGRDLPLGPRVSTPTVSQRGNGYSNQCYG